MLAHCRDVDALCLVKECRELEQYFGLKFTDDILVDTCLQKAPFTVEVVVRVRWSQLWDGTLDLGWKSVKSL